MTDSKMITRLTAQAEADGADLTTLQALVEEASQLGVQRAMEALGLSDANAPKDMADLRELLSAWRDAKITARKAIIGWMIKTALALLVIGLTVKLGLTGLFGQ